MTHMVVVMYLYCEPTVLITSRNIWGMCYYQSVSVQISPYAESTKEYSFKKLKPLFHSENLYIVIVLMIEHIIPF